MSRAFTLIELLIVIGIIAILSIVVVLVLNPAQILMQTRDGNRISDLATMATAVGVYSAQGGSSLGSANTIYVSIADPTATSTAGDQCQGLGLPTLPSTYTYFCGASSTYRLTNGTGWIPINFTTLAGGSPLGQLPIDPINTSSSRDYFTYTTNGSQYEMTSVMESNKYKPGGSNDIITGDGGTLASLYEKGTKLGLEPLDYGDSSLVGYWTFEEGSSSVAYDYSGDNATGSWNGTAAGTNGYYSAGKVGNWAGAFDGASTYVNAGTTNIPRGGAARTIGAWINLSSTSTGGPIVSINAPSGQRYIFEMSNFSDNWYLFTDHVNGSNNLINVVIPSPNIWMSIYLTLDGANNWKCYLNGGLTASGTFSVSINTNTPTSLTLGGIPDLGSNFPGLIDDVRIYNRALSAAEIQALYKGGK